MSYFDVFVNQHGGRDAFEGLTTDEVMENYISGRWADTGPAEEFSEKTARQRENIFLLFL